VIGENRDESKAGSYTLPDMMRLASGSAVRTVADWEQRRRPELLDLFRSEIYGYAHPRPPAHIQDRRSDPQAMGGKASFKKWPSASGSMAIRLPSTSCFSSPTSAGAGFQPFSLSTTAQ